MFDKMKQLLEMQKKMQEMKRELSNIDFDIVSPDGLVKISMNGLQEVREVTVQEDFKNQEKTTLEKAIKDTYNRAIKHAQEVAAEKMKDVTGFNLQGLI